MAMMTHIEKQFLFNIGEPIWTDTWFDIIPEEIINLIYRFVNKNVMHELIKNKEEFPYAPSYMLRSDILQMRWLIIQKDKELKQFCKDNKIKQSSGGIKLNKYTKRLNIWRCHKGRNTTRLEEILLVWDNIPPTLILGQNI